MLLQNPSYIYFSFISRVSTLFVIEFGLPITKIHWLEQTHIKIQDGRRFHGNASHTKSLKNMVSYPYPY